MFAFLLLIKCFIYLLTLTYLQFIVVLNFFLILFQKRYIILMLYFANLVTHILVKITSFFSISC
jgi:hypothetical protein